VPAFQAAGRNVVTVEAAAPPLLEHLNRTGASQCGACTPGFVMTIGWLKQHPEVAKTVDLRMFLSGNLCRCTGYDGIIEGVQNALNDEG
jgi:carbon-monoxide dehydrogenase small subunit